jgi:hypothetical protein
MTGAERKSAIQPDLRIPAPMTTTPTATATNEVSSVARAPDAATLATPAASTGAIVESAPTDTCALRPRTAIISEPTTNAHRPVTAGMLASLAVAICSGTAIATSVRPARTSAMSHDRL